jgi:N-acetylmuramoyl-L-alanine amidase
MPFLLSSFLLNILIMPSLFRILTTIATTTAAVVGGLVISPKGLASQFGQQPINQDSIIAVATPVRNGELHLLTILEQIPNQRQCWNESGNDPVVVDPLLLNFDFTGACERQTDSNGYSVRVNGQDLGVEYHLLLSRRQDDLVLFARSVRDRSAPPIEIGRTRGLADGFLKIHLNPGWEMTRRTYNGQPLGHIYLTHNEPLDVPIASTAAPALGTTINNPPATVTNPNPQLPPVPTLPPPSSGGATSSGTHYRVVVPISGSDTLQQVRTIEPQAFRTTVDGQAVVQVGLFSEQRRAEEIYQELVAARLPAKILNATAPAVASLPPVPAIPQGQVVVVIDPGHGGRDPGAIGIGGLREKDINTTISARVQQRLAAAGITVLMTRNGDQWVDLQPRADYANDVGADVFVSIHANAISMSRPDVNGLETYYYSSGDRLARSIHNRVLQNTDLSDRGVRQARFYVLRHTSMPAVLVETGFVTGSVDAARFRNPAAVNQIADSIAQGVLDYLGR